jgi:hypothetical protein
LSLRSTTGRGAAADLAGAIRARPAMARWLLAGPGALAAAVATMMAMPAWLPAGAAGVGNIAVPMILAPLLWAVPFFYTCLEPNLVRATAVLLGVTAVQGAVAALAMAG